MDTKKIKPGNFDEFRQFYFDEIAQDKGTMFDFFYSNNDIFQQITGEDMNKINMAYAEYMNRMTYLILGTYATVIFTNKFLMKDFPRYPTYRLTLFAFKYAFIPLVSYKIGRNIFTKNEQATLHQMAQKYQFGYNDYNRAIDVFERAYRVGKLDELVGDPKTFDWSGIPEYQSKYFID